MVVGSAFIAALLDILYTILNFYIWVIIVGAVLSWLTAFGVVNSYNRVVQAVGDICHRITEPALAPIRRRLPPVNGMDMSPLVLIFIIYFLQYFIQHLAIRL